MLIKEGPEGEQAPYGVNKTNIKYLLIVIILAAVVGGGILWCASKQEVSLTEFPEVKKPEKTEDETADWKIYTNEEYGFELKYPKEFPVLTSGEKGVEMALPNLPTSVFAIEKHNSFKDTWLSTSHSFWVYIFPSISNAQDCYTKSNDGTSLTKHRLVNGEDFYYSDRFGGAAVGTHYTIQEYKAFKDNTCFGIGIAHIESSDWNNPADFELAKKDKREAFEVLGQMLSTFKFINPVVDYLKGAELQYETEIQKENIANALNDILNLSEEQLKEKRYKDYTGRENQWDLPTLIYRYFVPEPPGTTLGDNFFQDVKSEETQEQVKQFLEKYFK